MPLRAPADPIASDAVEEPPDVDAGEVKVRAGPMQRGDVATIGAQMIDEAVERIGRLDLRLDILADLSAQRAGCENRLAVTQVGVIEILKGDGHCSSRPC